MCHLSDVSSCSFSEACCLFIKLCSFIVNKMFTNDGGKYFPRAHIMSVSPTFIMHFCISWVTSGAIGAEVFVCFCVYLCVCVKTKGCEVSGVLPPWLKAFFSTCLSIIKFYQKWNFWSTEETQITFNPSEISCSLLIYAQAQHRVAFISLMSSVPCLSLCPPVFLHTEQVCSGLASAGFSMSKSH